jgi:translation initiation factor IF-2
MAKKRVHELAKELDIESKEIIGKLNEMGVAVKSHMSTLEDSDIGGLLKIYKKDEIKKEQAGAARQELGTGQPVKPALQQAPQVEMRKPQAEQKTASGSDKQNREEPKREEKGTRPDFYRGSSAVDRVPSRPPDRRFQERPRQQPGMARPQSPPRSDQALRPSAEGQQEKPQVQTDLSKQGRSRNIAARPGRLITGRRQSQGRQGAMTGLPTRDRALP